MRKPRRAATALWSGAAIGPLARRRNSSLAGPFSGEAGDDAVAERPRRTCARGGAGIPPTCAMSFPPSFTASASGRNQASPLQASHVCASRGSACELSRPRCRPRPRRGRPPRAARRAGPRSSARRFPRGAGRLPLVALALAPPLLARCWPRCRRGCPFRCSSGSLPHAMSGETPRASTARESSVARATLARLPHARTTPSRSVWRASPTQRSGSTTSRAPRPSHAGHAPWGPLNENIRGSIGGSEMPQSIQAKRSLIQNGSSSPACTRRRPSPSLERELDRCR